MDHRPHGLRPVWGVVETPATNDVDCGDNNMRTWRSLDGRAMRAAIVLSRSSATNAGVSSRRPMRLGCRQGPILEVLVGR